MAIVSIAIVGACSGPPARVTTVEADKACEGFVTTKLGDAQNTEIGNFETVRSTGAYNSFISIGRVVSVNRDGDKVTNLYQCDVTYLPAKETWKANSVDMSIDD